MAMLDNCIDELLAFAAHFIAIFEYYYTWRTTFDADSCSSKQCRSFFSSTDCFKVAECLIDKVDSFFLLLQTVNALLAASDK